MAAPASGQKLFRIGGFADLEVHTSSDNVREGIDLAELDLYATAHLTDRWSALAEGVAQRNWQKKDPAEEPSRIELDLERMYIGYSVSNAFRLEVGQTHTGIVGWNEREHRSRFLQTPIDVPAIARRPKDDGAWPLRFVGVWMSGQSAGPLGVGYSAGIGAGSGRTRDAVPLLSSDRSPALTVSVSIAPDALPGLELAASAYTQRIRAAPDPLRERDVTLSLNYVNSGTEIRAEWARMNHRATSTGVVYRTTGYYALFSKRLSGRAEHLRPYFLIDRLRVPQDEVYLQSVTEENAWAAGMRYDFSGRFSVKGEYRSQRARAGDREDLLGLQIGFSF